jgi:cytochrome P450
MERRPFEVFKLYFMIPLTFTRYRSINGNAYKVCFWLLAYILHDPSLHNKIRTEVTPAVDASTSPRDLSALLERCPNLNAVYNEILRLASATIAIRDVEEPVNIGGKDLRVGTKIYIPFRQLHFNEDAFGVDAGTFNPQRFLLNKELNRTSSFRPFSGGITLCPGRFIAQREILTFTALVLTRFDLALVEKKDNARMTFPRMDEERPVLGIMGPISGDDVVLRVRQAKR